MAADKTATQPHFRFFDNREKYLLFVTTCSEKWAVAERVGREFDHIRPRPPALRVFDAGMGDATVLTRVMRNMHCRFPTVPFVVVGKEISLEDVRLSLDKMADRLFEHPQTVLVVTNLYYVESPWLQPRKSEAAASINWSEIALEGGTAHEFDEQIKGLQTLLHEGWQTRTSAKTGNPLYERPSVLVLYRADQRFVLDRVIPRPGDGQADYDLVIASQPYRARLDAAFKVEKVLAPLAQALGPGGRMIVIQSTGRDPGMDIIRKVWPDENPFQTPAPELVATLHDVLTDTPRLYCEPFDHDHSLFCYHLHAMPDEVGSSIGTSTLMAAWNAAVSAIASSPTRSARATTSTPPARSCASTRACGSSTNPSSSPAGAIELFP